MTEMIEHTLVGDIVYVTSMNMGDHSDKCICNEKRKRIQRDWHTLTKVDGNATTRSSVIFNTMILVLLLSLYPQDCHAYLTEPNGSKVNNLFHGWRRKRHSRMLLLIADGTEGPEFERQSELERLKMNSLLNEEENPELSRLKDARSTFQTAASNVSNKVGKRTSGIAKLASSGIVEVAENASSKISSVTEKGQGKLKATSLRAKEFATRGTHDAIELAEKGISDLRSLTREGTTRASEVARWIDSQAKSGTEIVGSRTKSFVLSFTGKDEYRFGDITTEVLRKIASQEVNMQDTILLLKILLAVGASFGPLAKALPFTVLLEALNVSLEQKVGGKVLEALALSLDDRLAVAFTSDDRVQLGDAVKRSLLSGILAFTGKKKYEAGDIKRKVVEQVQGEKEIEATVENISNVFSGPAAGTSTVAANKPIQKRLNLQIDAAFEEWDKVFRESCTEEELSLIYSESDDDSSSVGMYEKYKQSQISAKRMDIKIVSELEEWDEMFRKQYPDSGL